MLLSHTPNLSWKPTPTPYCSLSRRGMLGAQLYCMKGYNLETAMFLASLTGSVIYTDLDTHWKHLHLHAVVGDGTQNVEWAPAVEGNPPAKAVYRCPG